MQTIDQHNYEEFFLLYADNELNAEDRAAVEAFVATHPEKHDELVLIQQACLSIDETISFDKSILYKSEAQEINLNNYTEYFLLYVDNELRETQKQETERFVLQHPQLQTEFISLQQTVLPVESIEFKNKEVLYRKDNKRRPVIVMWQRITAVAALLLLAVLVWQIIPNNNPGEVAINIKKENTNDASNNSSKTQDAINIPQQNITQNNSNNNAVTVAATDNKTQKEIVKNSTLTVNKKEDTLTIPPVTNYKDVAYNKIDDDKVAAQNKSIETVTTATLAANDKTVDNKIIAAATIGNYDNSGKVAFAEEPVKENETYYVGAFAVNKTKAKGLLKKAINFFGKKSSNNDGKIEVASFAINTNNL